jgi:hypothetical protein
VLSAALAATPGVWWVIDHQFAMNASNRCSGWTGLRVLRLINTANPKTLACVWCDRRVGLLNKYSIVIFAAALLAGLLLTRQRQDSLHAMDLVRRRDCRSDLFTEPDLECSEPLALSRVDAKHSRHRQGRHSLARHVSLAAGADVEPGEFSFLGRRLVFLFFSREAKNYRNFGWSFVITILVFMITHGKDYYSAPAYVMLFAAGGVATERLISVRPKLRTVLRPACFVWLLLGVVPLLPLVLPVLSIDAFLRYQSHLPFEVPKTERSFVGETLPQYYADEFPLAGVVAATARVYQSLTAEEQQRTCDLWQQLRPGGGDRFLLDPQYGLPKAISGHQNYFLVGTAAIHRRES